MTTISIKNKNQFYFYYYVFAFTGLFIGAFIDAIFTQLLYAIDPTEKSKWKLLIVLLLQIAANGALLAALLHKKITKVIMYSLPGIIFANFLLGIQSNLYKTMQILVGYQTRINWPWSHRERSLLAPTYEWTW